jgi:AcrR family transcriptional regulator
VTSTEIVRSMRADARRNREKLLTAAAELFASSGVEVSLDAVAQRAGVGIGTLYRHFPTREALVEAAYRNEVERLCEAAAELQRVHPPDVALAEWMDRFVSYAATKRGMRDVLHSVVASSESDLFAQTRARLLAVITSLLDAATAAGTIRNDVDAEDVLRAMNGIWQVTEADWQERARKLLTLLMDGLRAGTAR